MSKLIILRGAPASGKTTLAEALVKKIPGKVALLVVDDFQWMMTAHDNRDESDYKLAFENYLYILEQYLRSGYTVVTEHTWLKKHRDTSTDVRRVLELAQKLHVPTQRFLVTGPWELIRSWNLLRKMPVPEQELRQLFDRTYAQSDEGERRVA